MRGKVSAEDFKPQTGGDHPRVCGEKPLQSSVNCTMEGLPPRMRGKAQGQVMAGFAFGITPAHAGKRRSIGRLSQPTRDHPRVCGEKCSSVRSASHRRGSPPRMRGKDLPFTCDCESTGITPACAGKRRVEPDCSAVHWDHPRVCGEKGEKNLSQPTATGSPPRVRGKAPRRGHRPPACGITPACAGKSQNCLLLVVVKWDHPRVCGEKPVAMHNCTMTRGSPPRVRGKVCTVPLRPFAVGITPACAGKSAIPCFWPLPHWDHPRVCGEKVFTRKFFCFKVGSPPRVRGKVVQRGAKLAANGITPACAGKSRIGGKYHSTKRDHPRVCGEKNARPERTGKPEGSPPRVRGKEQLYEVL